MTNPHGPLRVGVGGPVGSGKTALMDALCKQLRGRYEIAAITNDIYTKWDAEYLVRSGALPPERIAGVETGGCPHTAIREDASINLAAVAQMQKKFPALDLVKGLADPSCATSPTPSLFGPGHALAGREVLEPRQLHLKLRFFGASMPMKNLEDDGRSIVNLHTCRFSHVSDLCGG